VEVTKPIEKAVEASLPAIAPVVAPHKAATAKIKPGAKKIVKPAAKTSHGQTRKLCFKDGRLDICP
jgi:hypothetical protein